MGYDSKGEYVNENDFSETAAGTDRNIAQMTGSVNVNSVNQYVFMNHTYEGSGGYRDGTYLVPFSRESSYASRKQLAHYKNYLKPILRAMVEPVFSEKAPRKIVGSTGEETLDSLFSAFILDADGAETTLQEYTHQAINVARRHGVSFTVMDNFVQELQPKTMQEAVKNRVFPYVYLKQAFEVADAECDQFGNLNSIIFTDAPVKDAKGVYHRRYRGWTKTDTTLYGLDPHGKRVALETKVHGLGAVPVVMAFSEPRECKSTVLPNPPLYDVAKLNHVIYNQCAEIRDQERAQAFSIFFCQGVPPGDLAISNNTYINLPDTATISPGYASPDFQIIAGLVANQEQNRKDLFTIAEQNGVVGVQAASSGVAMAWDFFAHETVLIQTSALATKLEQYISRLFQKYTGEKFIYLVEYPTDFAPMGLDNEVARIDKIMRIPGLNSKFASVIQSKLARLLLREESPETIKEVVDAIEDAEEEPTTPDTDAGSNDSVSGDSANKQGSTEEPITDMED